MNASNDQDAERDLLAILNTWCQCYVVEGELVTPCAGHEKLADDPKWLIKLRFERYIGVRLLAEEWCQRAAA